MFSVVWEGVHCLLQGMKAFDRQASRLCCCSTITEKVRHLTLKSATKLVTELGLQRRWQGALQQERNQQAFPLTGVIVGRGHLVALTNWLVRGKVVLGVNIWA